MGLCHYCRLPLSLEVQRKNRLCPQCGSELHCCHNCVHYDESRANACDEPNSPWIADRAAPNQCPFFEFRPPQPPESSIEDAQAPDVGASEAEQAKKAFKALFRDR